MLDTSLHKSPSILRLFRYGAQAKAHLCRVFVFSNVVYSPDTLNCSKRSHLYTAGCAVTLLNSYNESELTGILRLTI